jgi:transcription elongation factor Elf1
MINLTDAEMEAINRGHCPDCNHRGFVLGPRGGMSQNIECGGCGNRFNVASSSFSHHIVMGQRLPTEGSVRW